ncbi:MAG TPA: hypothetical protein VGG12_04610 [Methylovirgula sp.]
MPQLYSGSYESPSYDQTASDDDEDGDAPQMIYVIPRVRAEHQCVVPMVIELRKTQDHPKLPQVRYGSPNTCPPWVLEAQH